MEEKDGKTDQKTETSPTEQPVTEKASTSDNSTPTSSQVLAHRQRLAKRNGISGNSRRGIL